MALQYGDGSRIFIVLFANSGTNSETYERITGVIKSLNCDSKTNWCILTPLLIIWNHIGNIQGIKSMGSWGPPLYEKGRVTIGLASKGLLRFLTLITLTYFTA